MSDQQPPPERPSNPYGPDGSEGSPPTQPFGTPPPPPANPYGTGPATDPTAAPGPYGAPPAAPGPPSPTAPVEPFGAPAYGGYAATPYGATTRDPDSRPGTVTAAAIVTIVLSVIVGLIAAALLVGLLVARDAIVEDLSAQPDLSSIDGDQLIVGGLLGAGVVLVWCLAAIVLSVLVLRRSQVARVMLVVSSAITVLLSLLTILSVISAVTLIAAAAVIVLLFTGGATQWFAARSGAQAGGAPGY